MKIYVINLPSSVDRRQQILEAFNHIDVKFEFFEAVDGRKGLPDDLIGLPDDKHRILFRSRPLSPGERGCYASHYKLWQKCVELDKPILILEDDCLPTEHFKEILESLPTLHQQGYEYLRVESQHQEFKQIDSYKDLKVVLWKDNRAGTRGYSISPEGAKKLLKHSDRWLCAVDNYIGESYRTKLLCVGIQPYAVKNGESSEVSTIQSETQSKVPILYKLFREVYRFYRFCRLSWFYTTFRKYE
ncbi:glycosyltransferase family 25 protein [Vibrio anguillarum]|uniref:glycosyltransferase family 25 protein n=1 Tax=Vibrio anguillarum TaxID=55601 RepID=UPI0009807793|nr:glycosyltransferase family 25 protein [Vibrio anguillarum]AQP34983.1 beta-1,4-galactosyltransferase [Vibrio anguillarum]